MVLLIVNGPILILTSWVVVSDPVEILKVLADLDLLFTLC